MKKLALAILTITNALQLLAAAPQDTTKRDSLYYAKRLGTPISKIIESENNPTWIIGGNNSNILFRVSLKGEILNVSELLNLPKETEFSDVVVIRSKRILVGTKNKYAFLLHNRKVEWLNQEYGLQDSSIVSFSWNKKQKLIEVNTATSRYLVKHHNQIRNIRFIKIKDTTSTFDDITQFFKRNFRWRIQKGICVIAADIDFSFRDQKYISNEELNKIKQQLLPGDIIIKRNDMQLANVGIPGFWTHSGIYVGSLTKIDSTFMGIPMLDGQKPSEYICDNYPEVYARLLNSSNIIIEAIADGVVLNPIEHIAKVDYLAALRTNLQCEDIFKSLLTAFEYLDTPYDYLFDFSNDNELVCSELIYLSYCASPNKLGVKFEMGELQGKRFYSPNDFAKQFCKEYKKPEQQFNLVFFFDAEKNNKRSVKRNEVAFSKTWKRNR